MQPVAQLSGAFQTLVNAALAVTRCILMLPSSTELQQSNYAALYSVVMHCINALQVAWKAS